MRDKAPMLLLVAATIAALAVVPESPFKHPADPAYQAVPATFVSVLAVLATRFFGARGARCEPWIFAILLGTMPMVYISSCLLHGGGPLLWLEVFGLVVFVSLAVLGMKRSFYFLAAGLAAHGMLWDLWHH